MSLFKCKMCGGNLEVLDDSTVCICDSCGTKQTLPSSRDEVVTNLFNRANNLRMKSEFDKAQEVYEKIITINEDDSEAYWGIVLCKFGIEYVEDPLTFKRIPTCHRTQFESILSDVDYRSAIEHADVIQKTVYESEAKEINVLQRDILEIVNKEEPFDIFICYKESDDNRNRTKDSVIANEIYYNLTQEGFKVFYAAITLEDKLGQEYEPYIFAALHSAKVMLVIGTKPEFFNAVWVKNEWSRYLKIMKNDRQRLLIPCYKDMDAYDLPEEFSHLQALDMSKIGFINDLIRGIKKMIVNDETPTAVKVTGASNEIDLSNSNITVLLKRARIFLEDGEFTQVENFVEQILNQDPENSEAYLIKLMAELKLSTEEEFLTNKKIFDQSGNYKKAYRFGNDTMKNKLTTYLNCCYINNGDDIFEKAITADDFYRAKVQYDIAMNSREASEKAAECIEKANEYKYSLAVDCLGKCKTSDDYGNAIKLFEACSGYKDSDVLLKQAEEELVRYQQYNEATILINSNHIDEMMLGVEKLEEIIDYKDSKEIAERGKKRIDRENRKKAYDNEIKIISEQRRELLNEIKGLSMFRAARKKEIDYLLKELALKEEQLKNEFEDVL